MRNRCLSDASPTLPEEKPEICRASCITQCLGVSQAAGFGGFWVTQLHLLLFHRPDDFSDCAGICFVFVFVFVFYFFVSPSSGEFIMEASYWANHEQFL